MINRLHKGNPYYAVRVTANDGEQGETYLKEFQDNEKTIPTILTTSQKLSTGVDALNVRNIILLRPVKSMIEFKQIIGRGTRLYDGKYYFTIYDFVKAYENFNDPTWDGEPVCPHCGNEPCTCSEDVEDISGIEVEENISVDKDGNHKVYTTKPKEEKEQPEKLEIRLSDGRARKIKFLKSDMFWGADGKPVSAEEFLKGMFGALPEFFSTSQELKEQWATPKTREELLDKMADVGYDKETLCKIRTLIDAENSDLLDVLEYIAFNVEPIERKVRAQRTTEYVASLTPEQQDFVNYIIALYIQEGVEELGSEKLPKIIGMKYGSVADGLSKLGSVDVARNAYLNLQKHLYL
jgi:type I restriction enzyme R subunit